MLFVIATGEAYHDTITDFERDPPYCDAASTCSSNCCTSPYLVRAFFTSFTLIVQLVLLNVVVVCLFKW